MTNRVGNIVLKTGYGLAVLLGVIGLALLPIGPAIAATGVPKIINYQGRLMDANGVLLGGAGTDYCFKFSLYDNPTVGSGAKLWPATSPSTTTASVKNGVFSVGIGDTNVGGDLLDFNFQDTDSVYVQVDVATKVGATCAFGDGGEVFETLSPRQRIHSSGYAINAGTVGGFLPAQYASGNQIPVLSSGNLILGGTNPFLNATTTNTLTLQGGGLATGDIQFFSSANKITQAGNATFAGNVTAASSTIANATSTTFFATLGRFTAGIIETFTATVASIINLTATNFIATNATTTNATTTNFAVTSLASALLSTNAQGTLIATTSISSNYIDTSGNWLGLFDGQEGSYYLANSFSTTSATYFADASSTIPKTYSNNTFTGGNIFGNTTTTNATTTNLNVSGLASTSGLIVSNLNSVSCDVKANAFGVLSCGTDATGGVDPFPGNATTSLLTFSGGLIAFGSSTIQNLNASNATITNATSTSFFSTLARFTTAVTDSLTAAVATITNLTATNAIVTNSTTTNATSTNLFASALTSLSGVFGSLTATTSANLASTTAQGRFITGNIISTSTATSSFAGPIRVGITDSSYLVSILGSTTAPTSATGTAILAVSNTNPTLSSGSNILRLNHRTGFGTTCVTGTTCPRFIEYFVGVGDNADTGGRGVGSLRLSTAGTGITQTSGAADFAEYMILNSAASVGDLVSLNSNGEYQLAVAGQSLIGVVSDNPAFVGNANLEGQPNAYVVGFAGVIETTVSDANGPITAGSFIAASTTAGIGVKLVGSGFTLGQALETWNGPGTGQISVLVFPKYVDAAVALGSYGGTPGGVSGYWSLATSTGIVSFASSTYSLVLSNKLTVGNASTTNISAAYASSTQGFFGSLSVGNLTGVLRAAGGTVTTGLVSLASEVTGILGITNGGTGTSTAPTYGQVLIGNAVGGYDLIATSSLGIQSATWGNVTGTLSNQTDLQNALDARLSLAAWYATTTDGLAQGITNRYYSTLLFASDLAGTTTDALDEGTNNLYYTNERVNSFISSSSTIPKTYTDNTFIGGNLFQNTTSTNATSTTFFASLGRFTTGIVDSLTASVASITNLTSTNVIATNATTTNATTTNFAIQGVTNALLSTDATGRVVATTSLSSNLINTTGNWTGTLDGYEGNYLIANSFSTSSADFWKNQNNFFSTTSAAYFAAAGLSWSTTSADAWKNTRDFFSTSSATYLASVGLSWSTTSAQNFVNSSSTIPKTYTENVFTNGNTFLNTTTTNATTTNLSVSGTASTSQLVVSSLNAASCDVKATAAGVLICGTDNSGVTLQDAFSNGATTTMLTFSNGLMALGSSTVANLSGTNATITNATSTSLFSTLARFTTAIADSLTAAVATITSLTSTNFITVNSTSTNATTTNLAITTLPSTVLTTDATGRVVATTSISGNYIEKTGDWTGTFDGREGSYYIANSFSSTSAAYFASAGLSWATTSADAWKAVNNFFSTTSAAYFTSAGLSFSTTSADAWKTERNFFSTTSAVYLASVGLSWSTTSANYFAASFIDASTTIPKTYTTNTWTSGNIFGNTTTTNATTTSLSVSGTASTTQLIVSSLNAVNCDVKASALGVLTCGTDSGGIDPFPGNATTSVLTFTNGLLTNASSTIGNGTAAGGLTVRGNATTTGKLIVQGNATSTFAQGIDIAAGCFSVNGECVGATPGDSSGVLVNIQTFTTPGTFTYVPSAGAVTAQVIVTGGGGGGGGADAPGGDTANETVGGGGGAGGTAMKFVMLTGTTSIQIGVGTAGTAGSNAGGNGGNGGISYFSTYASSTGGFGGGGSAVNAACAAGSWGTAGSGATTTAGSIGIAGGDGHIGDCLAEVVFGGLGGASYWGGGGKGGTDPAANGSSAGSNGVAYGSGGGGAADEDTDVGAAGGAGANGVVVVYEYGPYTGVMGIDDGGTGTTTAPTYGQVLVGNALGGYDLVATSSLGIMSGSVMADPFPGNATNTTLTFNGGLFAAGSSTVENLKGSNATITNATTSSLFATTASTTRFFTSNLSIGTLTGVLRAAAGAVTTGLVNLANEVTGTLGVGNGGTGLGSGPSYGQLLVGNASGGYDLAATSSLGLITTHVAEGSNLYYTNSRVQTYLDGIAKGYYFSTTSADAWKVSRDFFSTSSATYLASVGLSWSTTSANYFAASFIDASSTIPKTYSSNTFTGNNIFNGTLTLGSLNGPLHANNGVLSATTSIGAVYGGTGQTSYAVGDILYASAAGTLTKLPIGSPGTVLKVSGGVPSWGTDNAGGGGGASAWSTSTNDLYLYPADTSDVVVVGASATTTRTSIFEVVGNSYFSGVVGIGTTSPWRTFAVVGNSELGTNALAGSFTATSTTATSTFTNLEITGSASSSNLTVSGQATFNGNINILGNATATNATTTNLHVSSLASFASFLSTGSSTINGNLIVTGNSTTTNATTTNFNVSGNARFNTLFALGNVLASSTVQFGTAGRSQFLFDSARGNLGLGTTTSAWQLHIASSTGPQLALADTSLTSNPWTFRSINGNLYVATASPSTFATSSLATLSITPDGTVGKVGIGSTTPWGTLSVVSGALLNGDPAFVVATTSGATNGGQRPLLFVTSTTTGNLDYARVAIGTTSPWGSAGLRDQLTVDGRIYSTWRYASCDFAGSSMTANVTAATDVASWCGQFSIDLDVDGFAGIVNSYPPYIDLRSGNTNPSSGDGSAIRMWSLVAPATSSPVVEAWVNINPAATATVTPLYLVGMMGAAGGQDTGAEPTNGVYFIATSTPTWRAVTRSGNTSVITNTGIATSTSGGYQKMRVELNQSEALFLINGNVVARHTTQIPVTWLAPIASVGTLTLTGNSGTANANPRLRLSLIRFWVDDPPGDASGSGESGDAPESSFENLVTTIQGILNVEGSSATSTFEGGLAAAQLALTGTATSTAVQGIDIAGGCFAINGTCIGGVTSVSAANSSVTVAPVEGNVQVSLNLANENIWSGLQVFAGSASTTAISALDYLAIGRTASTTIRGEANATSTFAGSIAMTSASTTATSTLAGIQLSNIRNCSQALETDAEGNVMCGTDAGVGGVTVTTFVESGTWTKADYPNLSFTQVIATGGGGGAGEGETETVGGDAAGGGGGAGGTSISMLSAGAVGSTESIIVGTGGAGADAAGNNTSDDGEDGSESSFGSLVIAMGGSGGTGAYSTTHAFGLGGSGAATTSAIGDMKLVGGSGFDGSEDGTALLGGAGGASYWGSGGAGASVDTVATSSDGAHGISYGSGGGAGAAKEMNDRGAGGNGAQGVVVTMNYTSSGGDFAEWYETKRDVEAGDVVAISRDFYEYDSKLGLQRSSILEKAKKSETVVGVVASAPNTTIGADILGKATHPSAIALAGRVPVKVSRENGQVLAGDLVTLSSTPGVAMRSTKAGIAVGRALEDDSCSENGVASSTNEVFDKDMQCTVLIMVNTSYTTGALLSVALRGTGMDLQAISTDLDVGRLVLAEMLQQKKNITASTTISEVSTDRIAAGLEIITPRVVAETFVANVIEPVDRDVRIALEDDGMFVISRVAEDGLSFTFDNASSTTYEKSVSIDALGNALFAGTLTAANFEVGTEENPGGITMYDRDTREPYCLLIAGGALKTTEGKCGASSAANVAAAAANALFTDAPPLIIVHGENPVRVEIGETYVDAGATVTDDHDDDLTASATVDGRKLDGLELDTSKDTNYTVTYRAVDSRGNIGRAIRTIIVGTGFAPKPSEETDAVEEGEEGSDTEVAARGEDETAGVSEGATESATDPASETVTQEPAPVTPVTQETVVEPQAQATQAPTT